MKRVLKSELRGRVISHVIKTIEGELRDWDSLTVWLSLDMITPEEEDVVEQLFRAEISRLKKRL